MTAHLTSTPQTSHHRYPLASVRSRATFIKKADSVPFSFMRSFVRLPICVIGFVGLLSGVRLRGFWTFFGFSEGFVRTFLESTLFFFSSFFLSDVTIMSHSFFFQSEDGIFGSHVFKNIEKN